MSNFTPPKKLLGLLGTVFFLSLVSPGVMAAGTASGTSVANFATVNYNVAAIAQPAIISGTISFVVDTQIDLTVSTDDGAAVPSTPGSDDNVMTFTVTNTGNASQDFLLSAEALVGGPAFFGGTDNINADTVDVFVETAGGLGFQAADTDLHINALAADASIVVYIVSDFALGYVDGDIASYYLLAEARIDNAAGTLGGALTETAGADTAGSVDIVFRDAAGLSTSDGVGDAQHSSQDDYTIVTAALTISKASSVVSDPVNGTSDPKRIPGAIIEYEITIANGAGAATATSIAITDSLNTEITEGDIGFNTQYDAAPGNGFSISHPGFSGGAFAEYTNITGVESPARGGVEADWNVTTANVVTITNIQLAAGESAVIRFRVTIQ